MAQSMLKSRFRPVAAPDPELTVSFRSSLVGKGQVLILRSKGIPANSVNIVINSDARFQIGDIGAWQSKELGWVELDRELRTGDTVQVFIGSKIVATSKVP
jgi:hypothetical protein